jgi:hypothetical protein
MLGRNTDYILETGYVFRVDVKESLALDRISR